MIGTVRTSGDKFGESECGIGKESSGMENGTVPNYPESTVISPFLANKRTSYSLAIWHDLKLHPFNSACSMEHLISSEQKCVVVIGNGGV